MQKPSVNVIAGNMAEMMHGCAKGVPFIIPVISHGTADIRLINAATKKGCTVHLGGGAFDYRDHIPFLERLFAAFDKHIKAIVFDYGLADMSAAENYQCREKCYKMVKQRGIFTAFYAVGYCYVDGMLAVANKNVNNGEIIVLSVGKFVDVPPRSMIIMKQSDCFHIIPYGTQFSYQLKQNLVSVYGNVCKEFIYATAEEFQGQASKELQEAALFFQECNKTIVTAPSISSFLDQGIALKVMNDMRETLHPNKVVNTYNGVFTLCLGSQELVRTAFHQVLPFEQRLAVDCNTEKKLKVYHSLKSDSELEFVKEFDLSCALSNIVQVTFEVDNNGFFDVRTKSCRVVRCDQRRDTTADIGASESAQDFAENISPPTTFIMAFEKQTFSVCADTKFVKDDHGSEKTPIYISFAGKAGEKPVIGQDAKEEFVKHPESVIFDLIKLASTESVDIFSPKWGFKVTKENDQLMVSIQTANGEKSCSIPFLLALLIKSAYQRIKKEFAVEAKTIIITFLFADNEILRKNFTEAGKLLKFIDKVAFV